MIEYSAALMMGLVGSLHCAGMCGPLVLALPDAGPGTLRGILGGMSYASGKLLTYTLMGLVAGFIGSGVAMAGYQQVLSVAVGALLLIAILLPKWMTGWLFSTPGHGRWYGYFSKAFGALVRRRSAGSLAALGGINGLLPCGLVFVALGAAMATADPLDSALYMAFFGVGTAPMLVGIYSARHLVAPAVRQKAVKFVPLALAIVAVLIMARGLSLGIPYVSPKPPTGMNEETNCCH